MDDGKNKRSGRAELNGERLPDASSERLKNESRIVGYNAYTTPVEYEYTPFSPQAPSSAPVNHPREEDPCRKKKIGLAKFTAISLVAIALIVISSFATYLFSHYDFQLSSGDGNIKLTLIPREVKSVDPTSPPDALASPAVTPLSTPVPVSLDWDGTVLTINALPEPENALSLQDIFKKCAPSIVSIYVEFSGGSGTGTGIIISSSGYIVTNQHVVHNGKVITITLEDGSKYFATLVGEDEQSDLAVLKIDATGLIPAEFGDSQYVQVGDSVVAIGNPMNQTLTMTNGIISAINRNVSYNGYTMTLLQTNAAINEGNSGGPLINVYGQIIGITNMKMVSNYSTIEGIGFAIPLGTVKTIVDEILKNGYVAGRPAIGILPSDITVSASIYYRLPKGVYVSGVYKISDAYEKGILHGDIICAVNDVVVSSTSELTEIINSFSAGDTVSLRVYRNGSYFTVDIVLVDRAKLN